MENEKLQIGNKLIADIKTVKLCLQKWMGATRLYDAKINIYWVFKIEPSASYPSGYDVANNGYESVHPETFNIVKALNVSYWQQELERLEKEFEAL